MKKKKKTPKRNVLFVEDVPRNVRAAFKAECAKECRPMKEVVLALLARYRAFTLP